jgi:hypothetical protein
MAIKDKVKKAAKALKGDEPSQAQTSTTAKTNDKSTPVSSSTPTLATASTPASSKSAPPTSIEMPQSNGKSHTNGNGSTNGVKTPKTPQDEAIAFFSSGADGQPVQVWELWLEDDGGPDDSKSVSPFFEFNFGVSSTDR